MFNFKCFLSTTLGILLLVGAAHAQRMKLKESPFQQQIKKCFNDELSINKLNSMSLLYNEIQKKFSLITSETMQRETVYKQGAEKRKLKYDGNQIQIYSIDSEDLVQLISSENAHENNNNYELRYKKVNADSRMSQILFKGHIESDYILVNESRQRHLSMTISYTDKQITKLKVELLKLKKVLNCEKKLSVDICTCSS